DACDDGDDDGDVEPVLLADSPLLLPRGGGRRLCHDRSSRYTSACARRCARACRPDSRPAGPRCELRAYWSRRPVRGAACTMDPMPSRTHRRRLRGMSVARTYLAVHTIVLVAAGIAVFALLAVDARQMARHEAEVASTVVVETLTQDPFVTGDVEAAHGAIAGGEPRDRVVD